MSAYDKLPADERAVVDRCINAYRSADYFESRMARNLSDRRLSAILFHRLMVSGGCDTWRAAREYLSERLLRGLDEYGPLDLSATRNRRANAAEEAADLLNYLVMRELREERRCAE